MTKAVLISTNEAARRLNVSARTLLALEKRGAVPAPVRLSPRLLRWDSLALEQRIHART